MQPITRKEMYLNRLAGQQAQAIPAEPITREEQYLGRLCGENNVIPEEPRTRKEIYLANLCGEDVTPPAEAITRIEQYMAFASGERETKPANPLTREEWYWDKYQGGDVPEEKTIAFTDIITVTDALARPAVDLQSEITATQNLNGYEYPWVGGAGTNVFYHEGNLNRILNGLTATFDGDTQSISITGTNTGTSAYILLAIPCTGNIPRETPLSRAFFNAPNGVYPNFVYHQNGRWYAVANGGTIPTDADYIDMQIGIAATVTTLNATGIRVQIQRGSTAPTEWTPYENICPISGRTEVNVTRTGKNLCYVSDSNLFPRGDGLPIINNASTLTAYAKVPKNTNLVFSCATEPFRKIPYGFTEEPQVGTIGHVLPFTVVTTTSYAFNSGEYEYVGFYYGSTDYPQTNVQIELGSTATEYEPYEGDTFNTELGRTVYGGTLDLTTGELTITHEYARIGDLTIDPYTWSMENEHTVVFAITQSTWGRDYKFKCDSYAVTIKNKNDLENGEMTGEAARLYFRNDNFTTKQEFQTALADVNIVFKLLVPRKYTLTPTEVQMLLGNNTIWADSGRVQLTYLSRAAQRVQSMNASLKANTLKITKAITGGVKA